MDNTWFDRVPKVELHVHLEGAIPHEALWELVRKYGGDADVPDISSFREKFHYRDFPHFIETWIWKNRFLREYEDFTFFSEAVARDMAAQNIRYAEVIFSPSDFARHGLETRKLAEAVRAGLSKAPEIEISLVADLVRDNGPERAARVLAEIIEARDQGIIGITIGGSEQNNPPGPFAAVYDTARTAGLHTSAHAGEAAGPESVWGAIRDLKVERIGHGTRAAEAPGLVKYLAEHRIPVEICLLSNIKTCVVSSAAEHPVRRYYQLGIPLSINTDDPKMFGNSLAEEYRLLESVSGFTREEVRDVILQGIMTSWLTAERKERYSTMFREDPDWLQ